MALISFIKIISATKYQPTQVVIMTGLCESKSPTLRIMNCCKCQMHTKGKKLIVLPLVHINVLSFLAFATLGIHNWTRFNVFAFTLVYNFVLKGHSTHPVESQSFKKHHCPDKHIYSCVCRYRFLCLDFWVLEQKFCRLGSIVFMMLRHY